MVVNVFPPLGLANAFYLPRFFATDLVPTGTRSFDKKTSVNKKHFPAPGGNIYAPPCRISYLQNLKNEYDRRPEGWSTFTCINITYVLYTGWSLMNETVKGRSQAYMDQ